WLRLRRPLSMKKLFDRCLSEGILINPGNIYDRSTNQHLRLSYAHAPANAIAAAIERLSVECRRGP
ncbi:MAG: PLP-dependent aminotransferase family protein, partial [Bacilli bacterium]